MRKDEGGEKDSLVYYKRNEMTVHKRHIKTTRISHHIKYNVLKIKELSIKNPDRVVKVLRRLKTPLLGQSGLGKHFGRITILIQKNTSQRALMTYVYIHAPITILIYRDIS